MADPTEMMTLAGVMDALAGRGFIEHFVVAERKLKAVGSGKTFLPAGVTISEYYRFEGISDPDDLSILYALETRSGLRGTLADAFGVYADPEIGDFMREVRGGRA